MLTGLPVIYGINPFSESATPEHQLGAIGVTADGRKFRYARAGGTALVAGELLQAGAENTTNQSVVVAAAAIGATSVTTTGNVTVTANQYANGYLIATGEAGVGNGYMYKIKQHDAASGAVCTFYLAEPIKIAFNASTQVDLIASPYAAVIQYPTSATGAPVGVAVIANTANYYGWIQTGGLGLVKADASGAVTVGVKVTASNQTAGCVEDADTDTQPAVGIAASGIAQAEFGPAYLLLD